MSSSDFVAAVLGPVLDYDRERGAALVETLAAWFDAGGSLRATAEALHVHPNTVGQRLDRVGSLLGDDWRAPARGLDLQLALRLHRLRSPPRPEVHHTLWGHLCAGHTWWRSRSSGVRSSA